MPPAHRHSDTRVCGATTVVTGQSTVTVNGLLWAVEGDQNTHVGGELFPSGDSSVTIEGIPVINHSPTSANEDSLCIPIGEPHCDPKTAKGSDDVSVY